MAVCRLRRPESFDPSICGTVNGIMSGMPLRRASRAVSRAARAAAALGVCLSGVGFATAVGGSTVPLAKGAYVGAAAPARSAAFDAATGTRSAIAADYLPANSGWIGMDGQGGSLSWLLAHGWNGTRYRLSLGVPIIPTDSAGHPVGTLAAGAKGAYNAHFVTLARTLVAAGESNTYLRLGWEFDGTWTAWKATTPKAEANFAAYFRQIVSAIRSVGGEHFKFVWNPDAAAFVSATYNVGPAYPGNRYVDEVGLDAYDQSWVTPLTPANAWSQTVLPALTAAASFAQAHGKPIAVTEWGTAIRGDGHGLGDDPLYVSNMIGWMRDPVHNVIFETYFDYDGRGTNSVITGGHFPDSLVAFRAAFKRTNVGTSGRGLNTQWLILAAVVFAGGIGLRWTRRVRRNGRVEPAPRRVYPPAQDVLRTPVREWAEQTR